MSKFKRLLADWQAEREQAQMELGRLEEAISAIHGLVRGTSTRGKSIPCAGQRSSR
jgi:hypothetical protein